MKNLCNSILLVFLLVLLSVELASAQPVERTVGLLVADSGTFDSYTLLAPNVSNITYLIGNDGLIRHTWDCGTTPRWSSYLREDGLLLRGATGGGEFGFNGAGAGGRIQLVDWDGNIVWDYIYADSTFRHHHDVEPLPNGNVLVVAWESVTPAEEIAWGKDTSFISSDLWSERIAEIRPIFPDSGEIVWIWHAKDHLVQDFDSTKANYGVLSEHPELINLNYPANFGGSDWLHFNTVSYNAELDQIALSPLKFNEVWIIDHSTTTAEAADHTGGNSGKGGDLLYRWGNPQTYGTGGAEDLILYHSHDVNFLKDTTQAEPWRLTLFQNGTGRPDGNYSSADEIILPIDSNFNYYKNHDSAYGPADYAWHYQATPTGNLYSSAMSGVQRLENGNTFICSANQGELFEVSSSGQLLWDYLNPVQTGGVLAQGDAPNLTSRIVFKARRYAPDYPGLDGRDLTPQGPIETYCCAGMVGDANNDGVDANILDLTFIVNLIFRNSQTLPVCFEEGDINGDNVLGSPNVLDLTYLVNYLFRFGDPPPNCNYGPN